MASTDANKGFWAFVYYLQNNPYKGPTGMNNDDITNMANTFASTNSTEITDATQQLGTYTNYEWPANPTGAGTVQAAGTIASINQAWYPEKHRGA